MAAPLAAGLSLGARALLKKLAGKRGVSAIMKGGTRGKPLVIKSGKFPHDLSPEMRGKMAKKLKKLKSRQKLRAKAQAKLRAKDEPAHLVKSRGYQDAVIKDNALKSAQFKDVASKVAGYGGTAWVVADVVLPEGEVKKSVTTRYRNPELEQFSRGYPDGKGGYVYYLDNETFMQLGGQQ